MNDHKIILNLRRLLVLLVILLTFEGLLRKMDFLGTAVLIFFIKDVLIFFMGLQVMRVRRPPAIDFLWDAYLTTIVFFIPVIIMTAIHDPILALFGTRSYLLYPVVALSLFVAYENASIEEIVGFYRLLALLIIPTTFFAIYELYLPSSNWLNETIGGGDESAFSAGGHLRVSSTFSFVAQYCDFLNAAMFILMVALYRINDMKFLWRWIYLLLIPLIVVSCYVTGSRAAVVGNTIIIFIASGLSLMKFEARNAQRIFMLIGSILLIILVAQYFFPDLFAAYSEREHGNLIGVSSEIQHRVTNSLFDWVGGAFATPFLGSGLGIMSNGSSQFSSYAATIRETMWTETDFATTLFEGGLYLVFVWYGYRYFIILQILSHYINGVRGDLSAAAAFSVSFTIVTGVTGTLGIQPPIAIWWWLAVGTSALLWWKSVEPKTGDDALPLSSAPVQKKTRGRSAYAERLHGRK